MWLRATEGLVAAYLLACKILNAMTCFIRSERIYPSVLQSNSVSYT